MRKNRLFFVLLLFICRILMAHNSIQGFVPSLIKVTLVSNNENPQRAKPGDTITLKFTSSETIVSPIVIIENKQVAVKNTGANNWEAALVVDSTIDEGYIAFRIDYSDLANKQYINSNTTTDNSLVLVDKTAPFIISILRQNPLEQKTRAAKLVYRVTFNEEVMNVISDAFKFNTYGKIKGIISDIKKISTTIYDITVDIIEGGTIGLDFKNISGIKDLSSNDLYNQFKTKQTYIINSVPEFMNLTDVANLNACFNVDYLLEEVATVLDIDLEQNITWTISQQPKNGVLRGFPLSLTNYFEVVKPENLLYHPNTDYTGKDTFAINVSDGISSKTLAVYVSVNPLPSLTLWVSGKSISKGKYVSFVATGTGEFKWTPAKKVEDSTAAITKARIIDSTKFILTLTSDLGCKSSDTVKINAIEDYYVDAPIVFSPNGDGFNDRFVIDNLDVYPENKVQVIDRTGKIIFEKENYQNDWNGFVNNRVLVKDSYFYVIWTKGHIAKRGSITVVM